MTLEKRRQESVSQQLEQALSFHQSGALNEARVIYLEVIREDPASIDARYLWGVLEGQANNLSVSVHALSGALSLNPEHAMAHWHMGEAFIQMEFYEAAIACFRRARHQNPRFIDACVREGDILKDAGHLAEAMVPYLQAESMAPLHAEVQFSIGNIYKSAFISDRAVAHFRKSIISRPGHHDVYINLGNALKDMNQLDAALASLQHAASIEPGNRISPFNQSLIYLLRGDFEAGWPLFETRWDVLLGDQNRHFRKPRWSGRESLKGHTIFVYPEQGLGDTLQFCRYLSVLSSMGARVIFESPPELRGLMQTLKGAITLVNPGYPIPEFDFHVSLMSIPGALGTTLESIPSETPYLAPIPERSSYWTAQVKGQLAPKIGLAWSGGNVFRNDRNRSMPLDYWAPILELPFEFHAIQKEIRDEDLEALSGFKNLKFHGDGLSDFSDTASLIDAMDLIISVDTSVAHLSGALEKPVWVLLPFAPDFRWLLDRSDSPWYPSARLFRQTEAKNWTLVINDVRQTLLEHRW